MELESCLSPVKVVLPYTNEVRYVPCGKCAACRHAHNSLWSARLVKESQSHPFTLFVTLTYDDDNIPLMRKVGNVFVGSCSRHSSTDVPVISSDEVTSVCIKNGLDVKSNLEFFDSHSVLPYCSTKDGQNFIKRLRKRLVDETRRYINKEVHKDFRLQSLSTYIRYFLVFEYGPTTFRSHIHLLLWFSSELFACNYQDWISKAWKFGYSSASFAHSSSNVASYCAKYLMCYTDLPAVFRTGKAYCRPIFSRYPAIGTLSDSPEKVREIFDNLTTKEYLSESAGSPPRAVKIWRLYKDRAFPRLTLFDTLTHTERIKLYGAVVKFGVNEIGDFDYKLFHSKIEEFASSYPDTLFGQYWKTLNEGSNFYQSESTFNVWRLRPLPDDDLPYSGIYRLRGSHRHPDYRWFVVSSRVLRQSEVFGVSLNDYVSKIEEFYKKCDYENLVEQYDFENEFCKNSSPKYLLSLDRLYLERLFCLPSECATESDFLILDSFDVAPDEFFGLDPVQRYHLFDYLLPENNVYGRSRRSELDSIVRKSSKVKKKNDANHCFGSNVYKI